MNTFFRSAPFLWAAVVAVGCTSSSSDVDAYVFRNDVRPVYENTVDIDELTTLKQKGAKVIDVRLLEDFQANPQLIPNAVYEDPENIESWAANMSRDEPVVVYCVRGKWVSQKAATYLKAQGFDVYSLEGGIEGWQAAGLETVTPLE